MNRRTFFFITALLATLFGSMMIFAPDAAASGFHMTDSRELNSLFRAMGAMILSTGILNFMVRQHPDSITLRSVLMFNIVSHVLNMAVDAWAVIDGAVPLGAMLPPQLVHVFIAVGSWYYLSALQRESSNYP